MCTVIRIFENPDHWRQRAEESRAIAAQFDDPDTRRMLLGLAAAYEGLAERAAERRELREALGAQWGRWQN